MAQGERRKQMLSSLKRVNLVELFVRHFESVKELISEFFLSAFFSEFSNFHSLFHREEGKLFSLTSVGNILTSTSSIGNALTSCSFKPLDSIFLSLCLLLTSSSLILIMYRFCCLSSPSSSSSHFLQLDVL